RERARGDETRGGEARGGEREAAPARSGGALAGTERRRERGAVHVAGLGVERDGTEHDLVEPGGRPRSETARRRDLVRHDRGDRLDEGRALDRRFARQALEEDGPERVDVGPRAR